MAHEVLYRKFRPTTFNEMVGQEHVRKALVHALDNDRLHHAYLFTGTRGVGKTTIARILARCLNCETGVTSTPCGECGTCQDISIGRFIDLIELDAASHTSVDDVRDLIENAQYAPTSGRYKVYLIDEVHMLSNNAFNALLKTLEEPPPRVVFVLATTDPKKLPVTVLSRCLQFTLKNLLPEYISHRLAEVLSAENIEAEDGAIRQLALAGQGSMRDALSLTEQAISHGEGALTAAAVAAMLGTVDQQELARLARALVADDGAEVLAVVADLVGHGADFEDVLKRLTGLWHEVAVAQLVPGVARSGADDELVAELAAALSPELVQLYYQIALAGARELTWAPDPTVGFEMTLLRMLAFCPAELALDDVQSDGSGGPGGAAGGSRGVGGAAGSDTRGGLSARAPDEARDSDDPRQHQDSISATASAPVFDRTPPRRTPQHSATVAPRASADPAGGGAESAPRTHAARVAPSAEARAGLVPESAPAPVPARSNAETTKDTAPAAAGGSAPVDADARSEFWGQLAESLPLQGVARSLVLQCVLAQAEADAWVLMIAPNQSTLLSDNHRATILAAVREARPELADVRLDIGSSAIETPSARRQRLREQERLAAIEMLEDDVLVRALVDRFNGQLDRDSVRPIG